MIGCKPVTTGTQTMVNQATKIVTLTPEPTKPPQRLLLIDPEGVAGEELKTFLREFSQENQLVYEITTDNSFSNIRNETNLVISLSQPDNLANIVSASPTTQFVVVGDFDPTGLVNLSIIRSNPRSMAFMGGYLTTLIAWDWRSAGLVPNDTSIGTDYLEAFENGGRYVCGQCTPYYAPYYYFPLILEESTKAGTPGWMAQLNPLIEYFIDSVYVDPAAAGSDVLDALALEEYTLVGQVGTALPERFTALLDFDLLTALKQLLPQVLNGTGGLTIEAQVKIAASNNSNLISPAKTELFNKVAADLAAGWISPLSISE